MRTSPTRSSSTSTRRTRRTLRERRLLPPDRPDAGRGGDGDQFPAIDDLFTADDIGGWDKIDNDTVFGDNGDHHRRSQASAGLIEG